ncbi:glycerol kinase [Vibrio sp. ZSDE26]|uniref:Glycerol kinase n=1 Tax=Vibrio amylolyticus TaxID=2847292 RepID=A0A9X2BHT8_9VIBR|nr:glycerol kinase [Vibrio amylolyticus]MCK6264306.1 glycerol kinase [Vibrio amylolyticus]
MNTSKLSTSALAKVREMDAKSLFSDLKKAGYINRYEEKWVLTQLGSKFGGEYFEHPKFGIYIVWPEKLLIDIDRYSGELLSATDIGGKFNLNAKKINQLLSELGWITKNAQGWKLTHTGAAVGGVQKENPSSEQFFTLWHDSIIKNKHLKQSVIEFLGQDAAEHSTDKSIFNFRQKFEAKHRTLDGHYVCSVGELRIDNWLYMNGIPHAYQRLLPIEATVLSGFYLPTGNVYLQYWGGDIENPNSELIASIKKHYQQNNLNLIEIFPKESEQLDDILPKRLREFGVKGY